MSGSQVRRTGERDREGGRGKMREGVWREMEGMREECEREGRRYTV